MLVQRTDSLLGFRFYDITYRGRKYRLPSVTSILSAYPVSVGLLRYYGNHGYEGAIAKRDAAGELGSAVHDGLHEMFTGRPVNLTNREAEEAIMLNNAYRWYTDTKPQIIGSEMTIFNLKEGWAGTLDLLQPTKITDFKSSADVWETHKIQVATYANATHLVTPKGVRRMPQIGLAEVVRLDKSQTKVGYKVWPGPRQRKEFNIPAEYEIFKSLIPIYKRHNPNWNKEDQLIELPDSISINLTQKEQSVTH